MSTVEHYPKSSYFFNVTPTHANTANTSMNTKVNTDKSLHKKEETNEKENEVNEKENEVNEKENEVNEKEKEASEKEKKWWLSKNSLGSLDIKEERLPLVLARGVRFINFRSRVEKIKARRFFSYQDGTVILIELPTGEHETAHTSFSNWFMNAVNEEQNNKISNWGSKSLYSQTGIYEEPDACYVPRCLIPTLNTRNVVANPCDQNGNPWPTIILEVAYSESLQHVSDKINNHWFLPNCCEDVIVIKIGSWRNRRRNNQTGRPLRRLRCLKYCRSASIQQNPNTTTFDPIEDIEFGSVHPNGRESYFCTGPHMKWITIDCNCIFAGCSQPLPSFYTVKSSESFRPPQYPYPLQRPGIAIDLYDIQQEIFLSMGPN